VVAGLVGGLLGLAVSRAYSPRYEAYAGLGVSLDYGRTPPLELIVEDRVLHRVASLLLSSQLLEQVRADLLATHGADGDWADAMALRRHLRLDTVLAEWRLTGISEDPIRAASIANAWAAASLRELDAASGHAWEAMRLQQAPVTIACSEMSTGAPLEFFWQCLAVGQGLDAGEVQQLQEEIRLSHGVLPIVSYESLTEARPPSQPVVWNRSLLVISGLLAGLVVGVLLAGLVAAPSGGRPSATAVG